MLKENQDTSKENLGLIKKRSIYRRNPNKAKECRCYSYNQYGHYANECPKRFNQKKIELNDDIERMIDQKEFIQINRFEDLDEILSEESLHEIETETNITSSEDDSK